MTNFFSQTILNIQKSGDLKVKSQTFSNEVVFNQSIQCGQFTSIKFLNFEFKNIDFTGTDFIDCLFENCIFENVTFSKCQYWNCIIKNTKFSNSILKRAEFRWSFFENSRFFRSDLEATDFSNCKFKEVTSWSSNLDFILVFDIQFWNSKEWINVENSEQFKNLLNDNTDVPEKNSKKNL